MDRRSPVGVTPEVGECMVDRELSECPAVTEVLRRAGDSLCSDGKLAVVIGEDAGLGFEPQYAAVDESFAGER
jgi:hypothetical protein